MNDSTIICEEFSDILSKYSGKIRNFIRNKGKIKKFVDSNNLIKKESLDEIKNLGVSYAKKTYGTIIKSGDKNLSKANLFNVNSFNTSFYNVVKSQNFSNVTNKLLRAAVLAVIVTLLILFLQAFFSTLLYYIFLKPLGFVLGLDGNLMKVLTYIISIPVSMLISPIVQEYFSLRAIELNYSSEYNISLTVVETIKSLSGDLSNIMAPASSVNRNILRTLSTSLMVLITRFVNSYIQKKGNRTGFAKESYYLSVVINFLSSKFLPSLFKV